MHKEMNDSVQQKEEELEVRELQLIQRAEEIDRQGASIMKWRNFVQRGMEEIAGQTGACLSSLNIIVEPSPQPQPPPLSSSSSSSSVPTDSKSRI